MKKSGTFLSLRSRATCCNAITASGKDLGSFFESFLFCLGLSIPSWSKAFLIIVICPLFFWPCTLQAQDNFNRILGGFSFSSSDQQVEQLKSEQHQQSTQSPSSADTSVSEPARSMWDSRTSQRDRDGRARGILSFYLKQPGTVNVKTSFDFGPMARYGLVKTPMIRDVNGWVMGGYTEQDDKETRVAGAYRLYVQKWNFDFQTWERYADHASHRGGYYSLPTEGYYRLAVLPLEATVFPLGPIATTVKVDNPANDRTGKTIIYRIDVKADYGIGGVRLDCNTLPKRDRGAGFRTEYPTYTFKSEVYRGEVIFESSMNQRTTPKSGPEPYNRTIWRLVRYEGKSGMEVVATGRGATFSFNTGYWGTGSDELFTPGRYDVEAHLADEDQARGINQMLTRPGTYSITLFNCGKGRHKPAEPEEVVFEGSISKDCEVEGPAGF